ncbi:MAG: M48 family metalloprotease [Patescibacteria group bacterium]
MANTQHLFQNKAANTFKTILLMGGTFLLLSLVGFMLAQQFGNVNFIYFALAISIIMNLGVYWFSAPLALRSAGAKPVDRNSPEGARAYNSVYRLAFKANLPVPSVHIIEDANPNAFATGRNAKHAAVAVTTGLLAVLNDSELDGVIAHELAHIGNKDILISSVVAIMAGLITHLLHISAMNSGNGENRGNPILSLVTLIAAPIFATMIQLAVSRSREFQADATGALITENPEGLASALMKIHDHNHTPLASASRATAHMYISNPFGNEEDKEKKSVGPIARLFMSHPPVEERVAKLRGV